LAERQPVLLIFENIHWIDPTSHEWLDLAIQRIKQLPVLAIATFRPEFQSPWAGHSRVTTLTLAPLAQKDSATLVRQIERDTMPLPDDVVQEIVALGRRASLFRGGDKSGARSGRRGCLGRGDRHASPGEAGSRGTCHVERLADRTP
jgi:hypothetical protein